MQSSPILRPAAGWSGMRFGEAAPRWLPVPVALAVFAGSLLLYFALVGKQEKAIAQAVTADAEGAKNQIQVRMDSRFRSLARRASDWEVSGPPTQAAWEADAASYVHDIPDVANLEWIDPALHVRWMVPHGIPADFAIDASALQKARQEQQPVISHIVTLPDGFLGFAVYAPIILNGKSAGFIAGFFKARDCLDRYLPPAIAPGEAISVSDGPADFYNRGAKTDSIDPNWVVVEAIELHGATWKMEVSPGPDLANRLDSVLPDVVLLAGTLGGLLLGAVLFYAQLSAREAGETRRANAALRAALDTVETLEGLLPVCCSCKRVRDDSGYWSQIDTYLRRHTRAAVSHGYCPECAAKFYEECGIEVPDTVKAELEARNFE